MAAAGRRISIDLCRLLHRKWVDEDGDANSTCLRSRPLLKGPRALTHTGLPLHVDNKTVVKERIYRG